ncbi:MAG: ABC-F family ATP-binding cassette domain-containing protein [Anaerolineales bacterium]|nr:ABC-F family ATP-binding cassette domain-containing protein [Anaerolineales bacterium]MCB9146504.1 ABC-F family ATP-binding cassette domain-containing protein [Anaerolineales bacterium]
MALITTSNLTKSYGVTDIFAGLTVSIEKGERLGIVGPNGVGKTTFLRIIASEDEASTGVVTRTKGVRTGYLSQEADFKMEGTLWDACHSVFDDLIRLQQELHRLEEQMATNPDVIEQYGKLQEDFERRGGYTYETRMKQVLTGLGFDASDYTLSLDHLSGGQRTRAFLARLLLSGPDILLLDEPTNHLDIRAVEWLEGYLNQWDGAAIIVSHDRYFLDKVSTEILEMLPGAYETYKGNYTAYLKQREERIARRQEVFESEKEKLNKEMEYIRKNVAGQNVLQAKGKLKRISRLIQAIEQVGFDAALNQKWSETASEISVTTSIMSVEEAGRRINALKSPVRTLPHLHLRLGSEKRSGDLVVRTKDLEVGFPDKPLFKSPDIELRRQDCAALIGPNGAGKSTFLKTILGQFEPLAGEVVLGSSLHIGYFAQAHEGLDPEKTLLQEIDSVMPNWLPGQIRDYLGKYLFSGDDVQKKVGMLSGGERGRLALAKLALQDTNLLLLDEPTNHLDIPSQEVLEAVLEDYTGTILLISHDRYLVDALATQIWEVNPEAGELIAFKGTYSELRAEREQKEYEAFMAAQAKSDIRDSGSDNRASNTGAKKSKNAVTKEERRKIAQVQELENKIAELESTLANLTAQLESPLVKPDEVMKIGNEYNRVQAEMDQKLAEWERMQS